jgi:hypothetical protein
MHTIFTNDPVPEAFSEVFRHHNVRVVTVEA